MTEATPQAAAVLAVDVGASKLAAAIVGADGSFARRREVPTPAAGGAGDVARALTRLIHEVAGPAGAAAACGVASAGPVDVAAGTVSPVNIPAWRDYPLLDLVRVAAGVPAVLGGDGVCAALGEHWLGAGRGVRSMLGMVVSTGVGGGLVLDGRPYPGPTGNAGHIGHTVVDLDGEACPCGSRGCVETIASGPSMVRWALSMGWRPPVPADGRALATAARAGDPTALRAYERGARALAAAVVSAAALADVDLAVVGGGVAEAGQVLFGPMRKALDEFGGPSFVRRLRIEPAVLGRDASLAGAAYLALTVDGRISREE
jgi:glucokinase